MAQTFLIGGVLGAGAGAAGAWFLKPGCKDGEACYKKTDQCADGESCRNTKNPCSTGKSCLSSTPTAACPTGQSCYAAAPSQACPAGQTCQTVTGCVKGYKANAANMAWNSPTVGATHYPTLESAQLACSGIKTCVGVQHTTNAKDQWFAMSQMDGKNKAVLSSFPTFSSWERC